MEVEDAIFDQGYKRFAPAYGITCRAIVVSSWDSNHFKEFRHQYNFPMHVMVDTTWTYEELEQCYELIYSSQPLLADWKLRYQELGGLPRFVFDTNSTHQQVLDRYFSELPSVVEVTQLLHAKQACSITAPNSAVLVTFQVDNHFKDTEMRFVSDRVMRVMKVLKQINEKEIAHMIWFIAQSRDHSGFGCAFETWAHLQWAAGGSFKTRTLNRVSQPDLVLADSKKSAWYNVGNEAAVPDQSYALLNVRDSESIDGIYQPGLMFQMTISSGERIKIADLTKCMANMRSSAGGKKTLYIAVPDILFRDFNSISFVNESGASVTTPTDLTVLVVSIPMGTVAGQKRTRAEQALYTEDALTSRTEIPASVQTELLSSRSLGELESLELHGLAQVNKKPRKAVDIGDFPAALATHRVYKDPAGKFAFKPLS